MDFGSLLQSEIAKKQKILKNFEDNKDKKYVKASEIRDREEEYEYEVESARERKHRLDDDDRENTRKRVERSDNEEDDDRQVKVGKHEDSDSNALTVVNEEFSNAQVELRSRGLPIRLFGESDADVVKRFKQIDNNQEEDKDEESKEQDKAEDNANSVEEETKKESIQVENKPKANIIDIEDHDFIIDKFSLSNNDNLDKVQLQVRDYLRYIISEWDSKINKINDMQERNKEMEINKETKRWLISLLVKLKKQKLEYDLLITLSTIIIDLQAKDYRKANEDYIKLSIGNVAWPIGVMNVGIHSRSNHSKLTGSNGISNIMKDESTRKWILGIKRLISFIESNDKDA